MRKVRGMAQTQGMRDERKVKVFIVSVVNKCNVCNNCSKFRPRECTLVIVGRTIFIHVQIWQVFHTHVQQIRINEQRDHHLSQLESNKKDSSDVPIKSNRCLMNCDIGMVKGPVHYTKFSSI